VDAYTRQSITLDVGRKVTSEGVIDRLATLFVMYGVPSYIRSDNGPEFFSQAIQRWLASLDVRTLYVEPGSPWQNGYVESFHSRLRDELLNLEQFDSARHARAHASAWQEDYNEYRPHGSLDGLAPNEFARRCADSAPSAAQIHLHTDNHPLPKPYSHNTWTGNGSISQISMDGRRRALDNIAIERL
jgi:putative transposase